MVNPIKKMNNYFLSDVEDEIDTNDYIWFYGIYGAITCMIIMILFIKYL